MSKTINFGGGRQGGKSFNTFNQFIATLKTGRRVKYAGGDWVAMDRKTYQEERKQLLKEVSEKVVLINTPTSRWGLTNYHREVYIKGNLKKRQLKKLAELEKDK